MAQRVGLGRVGDGSKLVEDETGHFHNESKKAGLLTDKHIFFHFFLNNCVKS